LFLLVFTFAFRDVALSFSSLMGMPGFFLGLAATDEQPLRLLFASI
jgi:hypothetical protein